MTTDLQNAEGLVTALTPLASIPAIGDAVSLLNNVVSAYHTAFGPGTPDTATWTAGYQSAFTAADLAIRYGLGAATEALPTLTPSPSSPYSFDTTSGTFTSMLAAADAALAALAAPSNGVDVRTLEPVAALVTNARAALVTAYGAGLPSYTSAQNNVLTVLSDRVWSGRAVAVIYGVTWTPGP